MPKYQQGGGFESLFTIYKPIQTETPRRAPAPSRKSESQEKDNSDKGKLTEKDLFSMLKDLDGLPNEMQTLVANLTNTLRIAKITGQDDINDLATTYLTNLYKLKQAKYNRDLFKDTYTRAVENDSLNDIAITLNGNVLVLDKDKKITSLRPEQWAQVKESGEYQPLTNSNLLWYRSHHPEYVNNNQVLQIVENGIGLEQVHKMIKERFQKIGNTETSTESFIPKEVAKGQAIIEQMLQLGPEGYYKITRESSQADQRQVDATLAYIYNTLPANARTRLALETNDGSKKSAQDLIGAMIFGTLDSKVKYSAQFIGSEEKLTGKDKNGNLAGFDTNVAFKFLQGYGNSETFSISLGGNKSYIVHSNTMPLVAQNDKPLGVNQPLSKVSEGSYNGILDFENVSIGMSIINPVMLNQVIVSDGKIRSVDFPVINDGGHITPNLSSEIAEKKKIADENLRQKGINVGNTSHRQKYYREINTEYQNQGLPGPYDSEGNISNQSWARFAIVNVSTDGRVLGQGPRVGLTEITDDFKAENLISIIKENSKDYESTRDKWFGADALYEGVAWIPLKASYNAALATAGLTPSESRALDEADQALQTSSQLTLGRQLKN